MFTITLAYIESKSNTVFHDLYWVTAILDMLVIGSTVYLLK